MWFAKGKCQRGAARLAWACCFQLRGWGRANGESVQAMRQHCSLVASFDGPGLVLRVERMSAYRASGTMQPA